MQYRSNKKLLLSGLILVVTVIIVIGVIAIIQGKQDTNSIPEVTNTAIVGTAPASDVNALTIARVDQDHLELKAGPHIIMIDVIQADAVSVQVNPNGVADPDTEVIANRQFTPVGATIDTSSNPIIISTEQMEVKIDTVKRSLTFYDAKKKLLLEHPDLLESIVDEVEFTHDQNDRLYGIGGYNASEGSADGILLGDTMIVRGGQQGHPGAPLVWSSAGYGLLVDTIDARYNNDEGIISFRNTSRKGVHYYVLIGTPAAMMSTVADISGTPPLFPKWAMGFMNSEWGIDEQELLQEVSTYRKKQIPIDSFTLDFDWKAWSEDQYGEFRWNEVKFPSGSSGELKQTMDDLGIKLTGIFKPRLHVNTEQGKYASEHDFWWPGKKNYLDYFSHQAVNDLNFDKEEVRKWYFEHTKQALDTGIIGYWNDEADEGYTTMQFINMQKALYEGQREYSDKRVWSINRNYYLGAQKYAYGLWSGDITSGFDTMANQRERMLTSINVGQFKWGMDTGGFQSNPEPDNYARWMQFSAFTPIFRVHGQQDMQRQPWYFGDTAEAAAKAAIELRYQLIPYIYSYERMTYETGIGLVRPLVFDYPQDPQVENDVDSWMFGDWLLVSPVVSQDEAVKSIYLPQGQWINYTDGTEYQGGQTITHQVDLTNWSDIPLFIKRGAIIPIQPVMNYIGEKKVDVLTVDVFPDTSETSFFYYDDDGDTYSYETGQYFRQQLSTQAKAGELVFTTASKVGTFTPDLGYYLVKFHGLAGGSVTSGGSALSEVKDLATLTNQAGEGWAHGTDKYGDVTYVKIEAGFSKNISVK
ncbi:alpha-glucosidase [Paenibacillus anaericanus]|uniref:glycoside hydrolase family 31 protein n=1 Tax=Paenibacillus anaericanus TaxID=170367 RepID=UPI00278B7777|nr:TIM-barrel domain-containing protein [Paenibacillus anaericanus]MDQ0091069.1 alpha-glucosidase [Paenibacillus anaericanus]